jgi:hypothetical protein
MIAYANNNFCLMVYMFLILIHDMGNVAIAKTFDIPLGAHQIDF